jgi:hypothetical protein
MASVEQAIDLIRQYNNAVDRFTRTALCHGHGTPEAAARYAEYVERRATLIDAVSFGLMARSHNVQPVVDVEPSTHDLSVDTATFGTVTQL